MPLTETYVTEKVDAYETAINALRQHESDDDVPGLSKRLREKLADKLERELERWLDGASGKRIPDPGD